MNDPKRVEGYDVADQELKAACRSRVIFAMAVMSLAELRSVMAFAEGIAGPPLAPKGMP